ILEEIFDIKIRIEKVQDQHIAVYYR
ncbi:iron ABC transporter ATP-binding protein, partial [Yersinia enterocolitica]